ncbi:MAG: ribonuclease HII [Methanobacteriota archaeon]
MAGCNICGVDEAGKGPVLGPMVIAGVACSNPQDLADIGVMDSKVLSPKRREDLFATIKDQFPFTVVIRTAADIDQLRQTMTMNEITARAHAEVVRTLGCTEAFLDACDVNEERYARTVGGYIGRPCTITARHRADQTFPVVSAASIVAKVIRDGLVKDLEKEYGKIGSGYPADPITVAFLKEYIRTNGHPPVIARVSWATVKNLMKQQSQQQLI